MAASEADPAAGIPAAAIPAPAFEPPSWLATLQDLARELPGLVSDRVELLSLELHRAGLALAQIVALIVAAAILGVTAWLALFGAAVGAMVAAGLPWAGALAIVMLVNLALGWAAVARARTLAPLLRLPATQRHLTLAAKDESASPGKAP